MIFSVTHTTEYIYNAFVSYCHNLAMLKSRQCDNQKLLKYELEIDPVPEDLSEKLDFFGNYITRFSIQHHHEKLRVTSKNLIERQYTNTFDNLTNENRNLTLGQAKEILGTFNPELLDVRQYILESPLIRKFSNEIREYASLSFNDNRPVFDSVFELMQRIYNDFEYLPGYTNISTPINNVITDKKGVCQDFAQIAIACLRSVGLPARYISGYIETIPPPGKEKLIGTDASHAWFSAYLPGYGWIDFDPTNNQIPSSQHITVAWGRDYYDVPPVKGVIFSNGENAMKVSVDIRRID